MQIRRGLLNYHDEWGVGTPMITWKFQARVSQVTSNQAAVGWDGPYPVAEGRVPHHLAAARARPLRPTPSDSSSLCRPLSRLPDVRPTSVRQFVSWGGGGRAATEGVAECAPSNEANLMHWKTEGGHAAARSPDGP